MKPTNLEIVLSPKDSLEQERKLAAQQRWDRFYKLWNLLLFGGYLCFGICLAINSWNKNHAASNVHSISAHSSIPDSLLINGEWWEVVEYAKLRDEDHADGATECDERAILLAPEIETNYALYREVVWHEVLHAMNCPRKSPSRWIHECASNQSDAGDHLTICITAEALPSFINDNPDFMRWQAGQR